MGGKILCHSVVQSVDYTHVLLVVVRVAQPLALANGWLADHTGGLCSRACQRGWHWRGWRWPWPAPEFSHPLFAPGAKTRVIRIVMDTFVGGINLLHSLTEYCQLSTVQYNTMYSVRPRIFAAPGARAHLDHLVLVTWASPQ